MANKTVICVLAALCLTLTTTCAAPTEENLFSVMSVERGLGSIFSCVKEVKNVASILQEIRKLYVELKNVIAEHKKVVEACKAQEDAQAAEECVKTARANNVKAIEEEVEKAVALVPKIYDMYVALEDCL